MSSGHAQAQLILFQIPHPAGPLHDILRLLHLVLYYASQSADPEVYPDVGRRIRTLRDRLRNAFIRGADLDILPNSSNPGARRQAELYQIAALIYVERFCGDEYTREFSSTDTIVETLTDQAFALLEDDNDHYAPFLLLIFGSEARTDQRRLLILDLISRAQNDFDGRDWSMTRSIIEFMWVQDDLGMQWPSYVAKIRSALDICQFVPRLL